MSKINPNTLFHSLVIGGVQINFFRSEVGRVRMPIPSPIASILPLTHGVDIFRMKIHEINPDIQHEVIAVEEGSITSYRCDEATDANVIFDTFVGVGDLGQIAFSSFQFGEEPQKEDDYEFKVVLGMLMNMTYPMSPAIRVERQENELTFPGARTFIDRLNTAALVFITRYLIQPGDETYSFASMLPPSFFDDYSTEQFLWIAESPVAAHLRTSLSPYWEIFKNKSTTEG